MMVMMSGAVIASMILVVILSACLIRAILKSHTYEGVGSQDTNDGKSQKMTSLDESARSTDALHPVIWDDSQKSESGGDYSSTEVSNKSIGAQRSREEDTVSNGAVTPSPSLLTAASEFSKYKQRSQLGGDTNQPVNAENKNEVISTNAASGSSLPPAPSARGKGRGAGTGKFGKLFCKTHKPRVTCC